MKKLVYLLMVAGMFSFAACSGPSEEEKAAADAEAAAVAEEANKEMNAEVPAETVPVDTTTTAPAEQPK